MNVWRSRLSRWLTPLARRCPFSPNAVSVTALAINLVAAALLAELDTLLPIAALIFTFEGIGAR